MLKHIYFVTVDRKIFAERIYSERETERINHHIFRIYKIHSSWTTSSFAFASYRVEMITHKKKKLIGQKMAGKWTKKNNIDYIRDKERNNQVAELYPEALESYCWFAHILLIRLSKRISWASFWYVSHPIFVHITHTSWFRWFITWLNTTNEKWDTKLKRKLKAKKCKKEMMEEWIVFARIGINRHIKRFFCVIIAFSNCECYHILFVVISTISFIS